jgi:hypothetical protein
MAWDDGLVGVALSIAGTEESPLRVLAGPGTGKTYAMKRRVMRLLEEGADARRIPVRDPTSGERILPFAKQGYVAIASRYRLLGQAPWPAMLGDVKAAIRWTRANASRLNVDPARIIIVRYSAGGHLALTAAGTQNRADMEGSGGNAGAGTQVEAAVAFYPVVDGGPALGARQN